MMQSDFRFDHIGNLKLLDLPKIGFLASKNFTPEQQTQTHQWVNSIINPNKIAHPVPSQKPFAIISGFQSKLERETLTALLPTKIPIIMVLARGIFDEIPFEYQKHIDANRMLIISPFAQSLSTATHSLAFVRNYIVTTLADTIVLGALTPNGMIDKILTESGKPYTLL